MLVIPDDDGKITIVIGTTYGTYYVEKWSNHIDSGKTIL